ncbi:MAG: Pr6Pr family membrane protein [Candidatus Heimdallarchaeota archaeon]|nr:Pr6Pr family membrane protein [Candidatus Heimdallarchaeota archaeon]
MKEKFLIVYRAIIFSMALHMQLYQQYLVCTENAWNLVCFARLKYLSNQVNWVVIFWFGINLIATLKKDDALANRFKGKFQGATTVYIMIVGLAYHFLLSGNESFTPGTWDHYSNIVVHYLVPITMVIDWILSNEQEYEWSYLKIWVIYPSLYAILAIINGLLGLEKGYIYGFLDPKNGWGMVVIMIIAIYVLFFLLSAIIIGGSKKLSKNSNV